MKLFRWKAVVPLVIVLVILVVGWVLFADRIVRKTVEFVGTELVGARVDLASADIRLLKGNVTLKGLQVTNPDKPMTNLVQMDEIVAQVSLRPLLEKKTVLDTVAVRGVRFGTPRKTSGALAHPSPTTGLVTRRLLRRCRLGFILMCAEIVDDFRRGIADAKHALVVEQSPLGVQLREP